jgi:fatty acid-binding protein DegV
VSTVLAGIGTLLQIKPIISLKDGVVSVPQRVRSMGRAVETIREWVRACAPLERLAILHADYRDGAAALLETLRDVAPEETFFADVNTGIGVHIGPGALGAIVVRANPHPNPSPSGQGA